MSFKSKTFTISALKSDLDHVIDDLDLYGVGDCGSDVMRDFNLDRGFQRVSEELSVSLALIFILKKATMLCEQVADSNQWRRRYPISGDYFCIHCGANDRTEDHEIHHDADCIVGLAQEVLTSIQKQGLSLE